MNMQIVYIILIDLDKMCKYDITEFRRNLITAIVNISYYLNVLNNLLIIPCNETHYIIAKQTNIPERLIYNS